MVALSSFVTSLATGAARVLSGRAGASPCAPPVREVSYASPYASPPPRTVTAADKPSKLSAVDFYGGGGRSSKPPPRGGVVPPPAKRARVDDTIVVVDDDEEEEPWTTCKLPERCDDKPELVAMQAWVGARHEHCAATSRALTHLVSVRHPESACLQPVVARRQVRRVTRLTRCVCRALRRAVCSLLLKAEFFDNREPLVLTIPDSLVKSVRVSYVLTTETDKWPVRAQALMLPRASAVIVRFPNASLQLVLQEFGGCVVVETHAGLGDIADGAVVYRSNDVQERALVCICAAMSDVREFQRCMMNHAPYWKDLSVWRKMTCVHRAVRRVCAPAIYLRGNPQGGGTGQLPRRPPRRRVV